jgi:predicted nucleic acid-binding protein
MIVLDSDVLIEIGEKKSEKGIKASERILQSGEEVFITAITLHEVLYGFQKRGKPANDLLLFPVLDYTQKDAMLSSKLELKAEEKGTPVSRTDAMIAAIAVNNGAQLCSFNVKHFSFLKAFGLKLFN